MNSLNEVFQQVKEYCLRSNRIPELAYKLWIDDIEMVQFDGSSATLAVSADFKKDIIESRYLSILNEGFQNAMGFPVNLRVISQQAGAAAPAAPSAAPAQPASPAADPTLSNPDGDYEYTFETFIVGPSNKFANAACHAVAQNPANAYNPLFIYGGSGLGKTHLLCAISAEIKKNDPRTNVIYVKGEEFTNELIAAIANESTKQFHDKYRQADVLLVDDILANGQSVLGLAEIVSKARAEVAGVAVAIEKAMQDGGKVLRRMGFRVEALACVERVENGRIILSGD